MDRQLFVSARVYVHLERALGAKVEYVQYTQEGREPLNGIRVHHDFLPDFDVFPSGTGTSELDRIVDIISGERWFK